MTNPKNQARTIRIFRWLHRKIAIMLFVFFLVISITGVLLGLKKQNGLLAPTENGVSQDLSTWLPIDSLRKISIRYLHDSVSADISPVLDRIDIRPDKGIVKFVFKNHYKGLQLDGTTGKILLVEKRSSDLIENIHDGSILDRFFGSGEKLKIGYTVTMGLSLFMLVMTGFWLWYGPKRIRKAKRAGRVRGFQPRSPT